MELDLPRDSCDVAFRWVAAAASAASAMRCDADAPEAMLPRHTPLHPPTPAHPGSNWLLMYLGDAEVQQLARNMLGWVVEGGHVFFRESCFRQSGDKARKNNPTHYRSALRACGACAGVCVCGGWGGDGACLPACRRAGRPLLQLRAAPPAAAALRPHAPHSWPAPEGAPPHRPTHPPSNVCGLSLSPPHLHRAAATRGNTFACLTRCRRCW